MVEVILMQKRPPKNQNKRPPPKKKPTKKSKLQLVAHSLCPFILPFPAPSPRPHLSVPLYRRSLCFCVGSSLERRWSLEDAQESGNDAGRGWRGDWPQLQDTIRAEVSRQRTACHTELARNTLTGLRSSVPCLQTFFLCTRVLWLSPWITEIVTRRKESLSFQSVAETAFSLSDSFKTHELAACAEMPLIHCQERFPCRVPKCAWRGCDFSFFLMSFFQLTFIGRSTRIGFFPLW